MVVRRLMAPVNCLLPNQLLPKKCHWHGPYGGECYYPIDRLITVIYLSVIYQETGTIKLFILSIVLKFFIGFILF